MSSDYTELGFPTLYQPKIETILVIIA